MCLFKLPSTWEIVAGTRSKYGRLEKLGAGTTQDDCVSRMLRSDRLIYHCPVARATRNHVIPGHCTGD